MKKQLYIFSVVFVFSCTVNTVAENAHNEKKTPVLLSEQLTGEWRNTYLKVTMHTCKNSDSIRTIEMNEENWERVSGAQPVRTFFRPDGTYNSEHRDLNDNIFYNPAGKWIIAGDTLTMTDTFPQAGASYKYRLVINNDQAEFRGIEDFDQDGSRDDEYYGIQRKRKR